ncbi:hypothetical protein BKA62DRAFT_810867 [Auriculariales sp. MPI-PUGE-AT-0066]|nr:hypothetical protein BKA62DRAFT_810867 [Auriculariales sp. MPI-PUGE-AT-0066]
MSPRPLRCASFSFTSFITFSLSRASALNYSMLRSAQPVRPSVVAGPVALMVKVPTAFGSCSTGCRTAGVGDTLRIAFEGTAAWLTMQHDLTSSIVIGIGLDGSQTRYTPQNTIAPGCYNDVLVGADLDPSRLHVISLTILAAAPGEAFIFGGMTATIDQSASSLTGNSTSNVPGKQLRALPKG